MPVDYYVGKSADELLVLLSALQTRQAKGNLTEVMAAGIRSTRDFAGTSDTATEIMRVRYSLFLRDASQYPNPYTERVRSTVPDFYTGSSPR